MLSTARAGRLRPALEAFLDDFPAEVRRAADPVALVHRYRESADREVAALLAGCFAYGRVSLFKPRVSAVLDGLGPSPARGLASLTVDDVAERFGDFVYRFQTAASLGVLLLGARSLLERHGSLEQVVLEGWQGAGGLATGESRATQAGLYALTAALRQAAPVRVLERRLGPARGLDHLLPSGGAGAAKRLNLMLRWLVRPDDGVDLGLWNRLPPAALVVPLDVHLHRMALHLGLTRRKDTSWRTAADVTASLRRLDPEDPVRYDFALCHFAMSGRCPVPSSRAVCEGCALLAACPGGRRRVARAGPRLHVG